MFTTTTLNSALLPFLHASSVADLTFWQMGQIIRYENEGLRRLCSKYGIDILHDSTSITLAQGTATYPAPPDHLSTLHVYLDGLPLRPASTSELERLDPSYQTTQGTPQKVYEDKISTNRIGLWPVPDGNAAGKTITVVYHHYICDVDGVTVTQVNLQQNVQDWLLLSVLSEAYKAEVDVRMPEIEPNAKVVIGLMEQVAEKYWGMAQ